MNNRLLKLLAENRQNRRFQIESKDDGADIYLYDVIVDSEAEAEWFGGVAAPTFVKALKDLRGKPVNLRVNSPGGSVFAGRAMEQAIREHGNVTAHVDGLAASAATFSLMGAKEIVMAKGAMFMIHKAWTFTAGNADDLMSQAELLEKIDGTLVQTYADRTKKTPEQVAEWMAAETWFTAEEAVEHGFVDRIADTKVNAYASEDHRARQQQRLALSRIE